MAEYTTAGDVGAMMAEMEAELSVTAEAHQRYTETESYQAGLRAKYQRFLHYYAPSWNGDQWPEDLARRPGKIHMTANIIQPAVNIDARLQSILPRLSLKADGLDPNQRAKAEASEKLHLEWLELSDWEVWLGTLCRVKSLYGKGAIKVFWNREAKRPDAVVIENPANLRIGWGSSDYRVMDWALYEYTISPQEAMARFPGCVITVSGDGKHLKVSVSGDHSDPLTQRPPLGGDALVAQPAPYQPSDYEQKHVKVWDYWYKKPKKDGGFTVCNAMFVEGVLVAPRGGKPVNEHKYLPDIPYIVIPQETAPGDPEGLSSVEPLCDLQDELNRALSHHAQLVADEIDPAWVVTGENADSVPAGLVPKSGEVTAAGSGNDVKALDKGVNIFPVTELIGSFWQHYHKISGLSEILFGQVPGAQTSGRAVAIQVEAAANRLDPRRRLLYAGLKELLIFWTVMAENINPKIEAGVNEETGEKVRLGLKDIVGGMRRWKITAPEITPRDVFENTQNEINKVQGRLSSRETAMDQIGVDAPLEELARIRSELMDAQLNPESAQAYLSLMVMVQQLQGQMMQMQQQMQQLPQGAGPTNPQGLPPGGAQAQAATAMNTMQQQQYAAQPTAVGEDQNQPMTQAGSPPPAQGQGPMATTLIRGGEALNQLAFNNQVGG